MKNGIKKTLVLILSLMMVFSMMAMPVFADGEEPAKFPYSGENVNFIKEDGSAFGMFAPQEGTTCELDESGENVVIHYVPKNKTTYIGFNWGSIDNSIYQDESNAPAPQIKANEDGTYDITLSKDYCGYAHPIAPVKREYGGSSGTWTSDKQYYLAIPEFVDAPEKFPYGGEGVNFIKEDGSAFGMFAPQEGTTCELDESGENVVIHYVPKNKTTYVGFNWGSMDRTIYKDASYTPEPEIKANADGTYDITLSKEYCGYAHPIAPIKGEYGGSSGTWTSDKQYYLAIPEFVDEPEKFPYEGETVNFIKEDGSAFGMFKPQEGTTCELDESGENVVIHYVPKNTTTYVGFNWGSMDRTIYKDASYTPEPEIKANADGTYDITLSKEYCGYAHPIAPIKGEYGGSSGTWTSDKQYYLAIPAFEEAPIFDYSGVTRIYGKSRYETAMLQADALKEILGLEKFNSIIVATGTNYADALSGAYLGYVKGAPILLVHDSVIKDVNNYIKENLAEEGTVYLLGGEKVVPDAVTEGLTGVQTKRLSGSDRYKTNLAILKEAGVSAEDIIVCTGNGFADSLSASAAKLPILLVNTALDADQMEYLKTLNTEKFYLAGGTGVISEGLEAYIKDNFGTVERLGGKNRYETSVMIAEAFFEKPDGAVVAFAKNYPDGLCGGTAAAYLNSPLLLVDDANIDNAVKYAVKAEIKKGLVLGGPTLVSDASVRAIFSMSEDDEIKVID